MKAWGGTFAQRVRAAWSDRIAAGDPGAVCGRCKLPILPGQEWDVGHVEDLALGGDVRGRTRPEHARRRDCPAGGNRSAGAKLGNALRAGRSPRTRRWL